MGGGGEIPYPSLLCSPVLSLISPHRLKKYTERQMIFIVETSIGARNTGVNTLAKNFPFQIFIMFVLCFNLLTQNQLKSKKGNCTEGPQQPNI